MAEKLVSFRLDGQLKDKFDYICRDIGMSPTTAFTIFAKKVVKENKILFELSSDPFYSQENMKFLEEAKEALDNGQGAEHKLIEV